jgi:hypothetical protein
MKTAGWRILDQGDPPAEWTSSIMFSCPKCGAEAKLPITGTPLAQIGAGLVFEPGPRQIPKKIQCRFCRKKFEMEG